MTEPQRENTVEIILEAPLSTLSGISQTTLAVPEPTTVGELLIRLASMMTPELIPRLVRADGTPASGLLIFLNNRPAAAGNAEQITVRAGDVLLLCPPISGG